MAKPRAGGSWVKPWTLMDHVASMTHHSVALLTKGMGWGEELLMTEDEAILLSALMEAETAVERILHDGNDAA